MPNEQAFAKLISSPLRFRAFLLKNLPAAFFAGLKIAAFSPESCTVTVPFKWFTKNPFRSTYFACLAMAAELSTGVLAMYHVYKRRPSVSMLVTGMESKFYKKTTGRTLFTCSDGPLIEEAVEQSVQTGEGQNVRVYTKGVNKEGELVAEFWLTWSFRPRKGK